MKTKTQKGTLKITPAGPVNASTLDSAAPEFLESLKKANGAMPVEIDLSNTESADSGTIKFLLAAANDCRQRSLTPGVRATGGTADLLRILNMDRHLNLIAGEASK
ncbi:MAG: STAS domain-containing protein [Spartobacteria bacterium]